MMDKLPIRIVNFTDGSVLCVYEDGAARPYDTGYLARDAHLGLLYGLPIEAWGLIERQYLTMAQMYGNKERKETK